VSNRSNILLISRVRKIKKLISLTPTGAFVAAKLQKVIFRYLFKNPQELFTYYYNTNKWGNNESLSGPGSSVVATSNVCKQIQEILEEYKIKKF
jgi:hypothetical protein